MAIDQHQPGPGPESLPPPFGTGPTLPDSTLQANLATGGWNHLQQASGRGMKANLATALAFSIGTRRLLGKRR